MEHQIGTLTAADGTSLFTQKWASAEPGPARGTIVIAHGYGEHSGRYAPVAAYFTEQGYTVFAMDARGHGQSRGRAHGYFERFVQLSDDLARFFQEVDRQREPGKPLFLIGHSMGGLLALHYVIRHQPPLSRLRGLVTSGALLDTGRTDSPFIVAVVRNILGPFLPRYKIRAVDPTVLSRDPAVVKGYQKDPNVFHGKAPARVAAEFLAAQEYVRANLHRVTLPLLCMHGGADRVVSPECTRLIYERAGSPDKTIKIYEELYHEIFNEPERARVLADVWVWLASHGGTGELRPH